MFGRAGGLRNKRSRVEGSTDAARIGGDQVREVRFDGERLFLKPPARPNTVNRSGRRSPDKHMAIG